ncbi:head-tail adaptor protein [Tetragenococcus muriaticus]|uniref:Putative phage head-tail adaptor n=1 Tax=Tetragenococcus muriaticus 3MR10-3 TaxID=1302648 RepID=A0A091C722_9ENTE|nr:head-tail adaptor protein [Tetragenococcus muriaticus]KFN91877.1 putative phage head-tail adaptor [Tetragenococcus muriaticus 3MR10-3]
MPIVNHPNELQERVTFIELVESDGPEAGMTEEKELFSCWAKVRTQFIQNIKAQFDTEYQNSLEIVIRQQQDYSIDGEMKLRWRDKDYNILEINPDYDEKAYMVLVVKA